MLGLPSLEERKLINEGDDLEIEKAIRDPKDRPILSTALNEHADLFLTGDKDFLESSVTDPRIVNVVTFLEM